MQPTDLNADLDALTDEVLQDEYSPAPEDFPPPAPVAPAPEPVPSDMDRTIEEQEDANLEPLFRANAQGDEAASSLSFLSSFIGSAQAQESAPGKGDKLATAEELKQQVEKPKRLVKDKDGEIIGIETVDSLDAEPEEPKNLGAATAAPEEGEGGVLDTAAAVAGDVAKGAVQAPLQAVGGMIDAINNVVKLGDILQEAIPLPGAQIFDAEGNFAPEFLSAEEVTKRRKETDPSLLPTTGKADTVTGGVVRSVAQFVTGYGVAGKVFSTPAASTTAFFSRASAQGMFSDFAAFDAHEARLSDMVQSVPALSNPVTEYLASDPEDSEAEGRLKNVLEGMIPNAAVAGVLYGVRAIKTARAAKAATGAQTYTQAADALAENIRATGELPTSGAADPMRLIGDSSPEAPLVRLKTIDGIEPKDIANAGKEVASDGTTVKTVPGPKENIGDTFFNFAKFNSTDDIESVMKELMNARADEIRIAQRGVQTNIETLKKAEGKYDEVWQGLLTRKTGELKFNAEEQTAMRIIWEASGARVLEVATQAQAMPTLENLLAFRKMVSVHDMIQNHAMAVRTETARAQQAWNIPVGVVGRERLAAMQNIMLQHGGTDLNIDLVRKFAALADEVKNNPDAMAKVSKATEKTAGARTINAISEAWMGLGLLSGPKTHLRNIISNAGMIAASVADRAVAARAQGLIDDKTAVALGEASAQVAGTFGNVKKAWLDAVETFKTGKMKMGMSQLDTPPEMAMRSLDRNTVFGRTMYALSYPTDVVFGTLRGTDQFFKTLNFEGEMSALAHRSAVQAAQEGKIPRDKIGDYAADFLANPPEAVVADAMEKAAYRTFTNEPGPLTRSILNFRHDFPLARFIIPFVNTPANVFRTAIEYSPMAPVLSKYKAAIEKGGSEAALARTRLGMGTTALFAAVDLTMSGKITGSGPEPGTAEYQALARTGWRPYTIRIGDKWVSYRGIDPFSTMLGIGADIGDYVRYAENDLDSVEAVKDMLAIGVFGFAGSMLDRSFLTGLADAISAAIDPDRYGAQWVDSFASSFVPRAITEVRNAIDPTVRDARTMMDAFKARIPYMSMTVPERRDEWGRTRSMESQWDFPLGDGFNAVWGKAYDAASPFAVSQVNVQPIDRELIRQGFGAGGVQRAMRLDGVSVSLANRADIHNRYLELRGQFKPSQLGKEGQKLKERYGDQTLLDVLNGIVTGAHPLAEEYAKGSDGEGGRKHRMIQKVVRDYGKAAKDILFKEYPEIEGKADEKNQKRRDRASGGERMVNDLLQIDIPGNPPVPQPMQ